MVKPSEEELIEGTIIEFSDSGKEQRFFAVVEITGQERVVVPVGALVSLQEPGVVPD